MKRDEVCKIVDDKSIKFTVEELKQQYRELVNDIINHMQFGTKEFPVSYGEQFAFQIACDLLDHLK